MKKPHRLIIGLTGGYGSGKSTVAKMFRSMGARVVDADALAREALSPEKAPRRAVTRAFGKDLVGKDGEIDRARLAGRTFKSAAERRRLEKIVHPYVARRLRQEGRRLRRGVLIMEIPLLFEARLQRLVDKTVVVWAPESVRRRRLAGRGVPASDFRRRSAAQWPLEKKARLADAVIDNGLAPAHARRQVFRLLQSWLARPSRKR